MNTRILWTVLPNGLVDGKLRFSLYASPRLETPSDDTLASSTLSPDIKSLAERVLDMRLAVRIGGLSVGAERIKLPGMPDPSPKLSAYVLPPDTYVRGFEVKDNTSRNVRSFDVATVHQALEAVSAEAAAKGTMGFPSLDDGSLLAGLLGALSQVGFTQGEGPLAHSKMQDSMRNATDAELIEWATNVVSDPAMQKVAGEFLRAYFFYLRGERHDYDTSFAYPKITLPKPEFHEILTALGDNPTLLRQLGLVSDWVVPHAIVAGQMPGDMVLDGVGALPAESTISVLELSGFGGVNSELPATAYRISKAGFLPRPDEKRGSDIYEGMLRMGGKKPGFSVFTRDVDGGAIKLLDHAVNITRWQHKDSKNAPKAHSLPSSRTAGLTVAKAGRAAVTTLSFKTALALDTATRGNPKPGSAVLYADDVRRGYRVDVRVAELDKWYSLVARGGAYSVGELTFAPGDAEGYVKASGGTGEIGETGPSARLYVHEAIFGWDGWSLAARRPGKAVTLDGTSDVKNEPKLGVPIRTEWKVTPGTLPRLRYGRSYSFRARVVDLAGNSLSFSDETTKVMPYDAPTEPVRYLRHEPVAAPALVPQRAFGEGESLERLVIRSDVGVSAEAYAAASVGSGELPRYVGVCVRHVAPPKTSQAEAETHGMLDAFADPASKHHVSSKEEGTFLDTTIVDWKTGAALPVTDGVLVSKTGRQLDDLKKGDPLDDGEYVIHTSQEVAVPYLPDPLSAGVSLWTQALRKDEASPADIVPFNGNPWPAIRASRFRLVEAPAASITHDADGNIVIGLPPATILPAKMASLPDAKACDQTLALWAAAVSGAKDETEQGKNWTVSPSREITFVHAVQHPLEPATIGKFYNPSRQSGDTSVVVRGMIKVHGRSTGDIEMRASWTDLVDRVDDDKWTTEQHAGRAFGLRVAYEQDIRPIGGGHEQGERHELGDTKHRNIVYQPNATSRFREYFPVELIVDPANITTPGTLGEGGVLAAPDALSPYFKPGMLSVPSSARPAPPAVLYVVPTFRWQKSADGSSVTRVGRGLRIYLDRPWFTTGVGERLAVLVQPSAEAARKYASEWASDPLWTATAPKEDLAPKHFADVTYPPEAGEEATHPERTYKRVVGPFPLAEDPSLSMTAVALMPEYHEERRLWFVDLELDPGPGAYFPFVRLALARCQPDSIWGHELSTVVKAEIAQLTPDRVATVTVGKSIDVTVSGVVALNAYGAFTSGWKPPAPAPAGTSPAPTGASTTVLKPGNLGGVVDGVVLPKPIEIPDPKAGAGRRVTAQLQRREKGEGDLAWTDVAAEATLASYRSLFGGSDTIFRGSVPGAAIYQKEASSFEHRVLVREYESYVADQETAPSGVAERIAYAAEIRLA